MRLFLDTEYTDPEHQQLISIGIISEDGRRSFYGELDEYDEGLCNRFVRENVLPHLEHQDMNRDQLARVLHEWFATLPQRVFFACDSYDDIKLVMTLLGERPANLIENWLDLRSLIDTTVYHNAVEAYHTPDKPWHHALHDAEAHRAGWLAWMDLNKSVPIKPHKREPLVQDALDELIALKPAHFKNGRPVRSWLPKTWLNLAVELFDELSVSKPDLQVSFIKESGGGLDVSVDDRTRPVRELLQEFYRRSASICILCGKQLYYSKDESAAVLGYFACYVCSKCKPQLEGRGIYR